jgi:hypothetical protein
MEKFILLLNNWDNEPEFKVVEAKNEKEALANYLIETFYLDNEEISEKDMAENILKDEFYGVASLEIGEVEFTFYTDLKSLGL